MLKRVPTILSRIFLLSLLLSICGLPGKSQMAQAFASATSIDDDYRQQLIDHFKKKGKDISGYFEDSRFERVDDITSKFTRSAEVQIENVDDYKKILKYDNKISKIQEFVRLYESDLEEAENTYSIPKEVIVGILGIESEFGTYSGKYNPFNVYVSMYAENYRSRFALAQLEELIIFVDNNELDVFDLKSSYAGAMSFAQFVPWSLNRWFVGPDLYDMRTNILSVANYLAHYKDVTGSLEKAVLRYNPSSLYQQAVLSLAEDARPYLGR